MRAEEISIKVEEGLSHEPPESEMDGTACLLACGVRRSCLPCLDAWLEWLTTTCNIGSADDQETGIFGTRWVYVVTALAFGMLFHSFFFVMLLTPLNVAAWTFAFSTLLFLSITITRNEKSQFGEAIGLLHNGTEILTSCLSVDPFDRRVQMTAVFLASTASALQVIYVLRLPAKVQGPMTFALSISMHYPTMLVVICNVIRDLVFTPLGVQKLYLLGIAWGLHVCYEMYSFAALFCKIRFLPFDQRTSVICYCLQAGAIVLFLNENSK